NFSIQPRKTVVRELRTKSHANLSHPHRDEKHVLRAVGSAMNQDVMRCFIDRTSEGGFLNPDAPDGWTMQHKRKLVGLPSLEWTRSSEFYSPICHEKPCGGYHWAAFFRREAQCSLTCLTGTGSDEEDTGNGY